jgi:sulfur relay (sulfurtransferase) DsrF/TusC family protein
MPKTVHGVYLVFGKTKIKLKPKDLQLFADALEIVNPDTVPQTINARNWSSAFSALSEYGKSVKRA